MNKNTCSSTPPDNFSVPNSSRIDWIDMAKGIGIVFVIVAHLGKFGNLQAWIYSFHMPLFFFLSGYVFREEDKLVMFLKKKIKSMIVPYFCLGIPMIAFDFFKYWYKGKDEPQKYLFILIKSFVIQRRFWTLWFLACLFFLNIGFFFIIKIFKSRLLIGIISIVSPIIGLLYYKFIGIALPWNVDVCFMALPFFCAGFLYKLNATKVDKILDTTQYSIIIFLFSGVLNVVCGYFTYKLSGQHLEMFCSEYGYAPLTFLAAFAGVLCVVIISKWFTVRSIKYIGKFSLLYFAWHQTIFIPISEKSLTYFNLSFLGSFEIVVCTVFQVLIIIGLITICNLIISNTKLKFMLGKFQKKV